MVAVTFDSCQRMQAIKGRVVRECYKNRKITQTAVFKIIIIFNKSKNRRVIIAIIIN